MMSGFGRCGEWFAWQRYGEDGRPDLMSLAKGLTAFVDRARKEGVSFATRGNLVLIAPPLVIGEEDLMDGLSLMERLLKGLEWS